MTLIDHQIAAKERLITQYKESETLQAYLDAVLVLANDLEQVFNDLLLLRFIDTAEGEILNIIGDLVGQQRLVIDNVALTDVEYRVFIRARIIKNTTRATRESIIEMITFIFSVTSVTIEEGDREYAVTIVGVLSADERALIGTANLLPKPAGIKDNFILVDSVSGFFMPSVGSPPPAASGTFGNYLTPGTGGLFATIL